MLKENGRFKPAKKEEMAKLKGKKMRCLNCGKDFTVDKAQFANTNCSECGATLVDSGMASSGKATGN
jgi:ribosomal protein S27E